MRRLVNNDPLDKLIVLFVSIWSKPYLLGLAASLAASALVQGQSAPQSFLPDAPDVAQSVQPSATAGVDAVTPAASEGGIEKAAVAVGPGEIAPGKPYLHRTVPPGMGLQPLTAGQKFELSFRSRFSLGAFSGALFGAGWSHLNNSRPHYGTDRGAFGERLGAAELKQTSESFFSSGLYASAFHEDPHYYVMGPGPGHGVAHRAIYAATRVLVTRTDNGGTSVNFAKLTGLASSNALANVYYPAEDQAVSKTITSFFTNIGTSALSLELNEFLPDVVHAVRHRHQPTD